MKSALNTPSGKDDRCRPIIKTSACCLGLQGVLNWVAQPRPGQEPPSFQANLYDVLFKSQNPGVVSI